MLTYPVVLDREQHDFEDEEEEPVEPSRRSLFEEWWFRILLAGVALLVVAVVALPYLLDWWSPVPTRSLAVVKVPREPVRAPDPRTSELAPPPSVATAPAPPLTEQPVTMPEPPVVPPPTTKPEAATASPSPRVTAKVPKAAPRAAGKVLAAAAPKKKSRALTKAGRAPSKGKYWVQVGAFTTATYAERLAATLSAEHYPVRRATVSRHLPDHHEVVIIGAAKSEVDGKLPGKTYEAEAVGDRVVVHPALPLKRAVVLARQLTATGFTVKIQRAKGPATLYVVLVGGYPDRTRAQAVRAELDGKGVSGFIVEQDEDS